MLYSIDHTALPQNFLLAPIAFAPETAHAGTLSNTFHWSEVAS